MITLIYALIALLLAVSVGPAQARGAEPSFSVFPNPDGAGGGETGITAGPDGNVWFTLNVTQKIGRVTPTGVVTIFSAGSYGSGSGPTGITAARDRNLWFSGDGGLQGSVRRISRTGAVIGFGQDELNGPAGVLGHQSITAGPDADVWYTSSDAEIRKITTAGLAGVPRSTGNTGELRSITVGPDGNLWFTKDTGVGRITPAGAVTFFTAGITTGTGLNGPVGIAAGPDGNLWYTVPGADRIGRITTAGVVLQELGTEDGISPGFSPLGITAGPDGNLWYTGFGGLEKAIGRITPAGVVTEFDPAPGFIQPVGITTGPDGNVWFAARSNVPGNAGVGKITLGEELVVVKAGAGQGTVTSAPAGIDCGPDCRQNLREGTVVTLTAAAVPGSSFAGFTGPCTGVGATCVVTLDQARTVTASFARQPVLTVTRAGTGAGALTSSPAGIDCGADCSQSYDRGTLVTLTAAPETGSRLAGFSGGGCSGTGPTCTVTLDQSASVTATFTRPTAATPPPASKPKTPTPGAGGKTINGTPGKDRLVGTAGNDVINCGAGDDVVIAGGGNDTINCGAGNDKIDAGAGNDRVTGGSGNDRVSGGSGNDTISGGSGKDRLSGGTGRDRLSGGSGDDRLSGNGGNDRLLGNSGNDRLAGGAGRDRLSGGPGKDVLVGGPGFDLLNGGPGSDRQRQ